MVHSTHHQSVVAGGADFDQQAYHVGRVARLAGCSAGRTMPTERLAAMRLIATPGTVLPWHRDILRRRRARVSRRGRSGRPATHRKVRSMVLRLARENES
jgi:hypothetical protein